MDDCVSEWVHVCVFTVCFTSLLRSWIQPRALFFSFLSSLSLIELTDEVQCDPVRRANTDRCHETQPQGTEQEAREMYTESHYSGPISCKCIHPPPLFVQQRYQCVCVFMAFCLHDSRVSQSINQTSYCTAAVQMVALGFLSIQFTADFHLQILHTPSPAARAPPAADMSRFQKRRKINHHRNVWSHDVRGAFKCWVIRSFLHTCSSSSEK